MFAISSLLVTTILAAACGPKDPPPPLAPRPNSPSTPTRTGTTDLPAAPVVEASVVPDAIQAGDSALLSWQSENADRVSIEPGIGTVDRSGQIRIFPQATTRYVVSARGRGGNAEASASVRVVSAETRIPVSDIGSTDLPLAERFELYVKHVFFEFDSAQLSSEARVTLEGNARWLVQNPETRFIIEGHCDTRGTDEYNLALGDKRAQVVQEYLVSKGIDAARVVTISYGEERPFESGDTDEAHASNRRAHFVLITP